MTLNLPLLSGLNGLTHSPKSANSAQPLTQLPAETPDASMNPPTQGAEPLTGQPPVGEETLTDGNTAGISNRVVQNKTFSGRNGTIEVVNGIIHLPLPGKNTGAQQADSASKAAVQQLSTQAYTVVNGSEFNHRDLKDMVGVQHNRTGLTEFYDPSAGKYLTLSPEDPTPKAKRSSSFLQFDTIG
jgi:hypothetical protein